MKKRFSEEQIIGFLREADKGVAVKELCRKHGFSEASYYRIRHLATPTAALDPSALDHVHHERRIGPSVSKTTSAEHPSCLDPRISATTAPECVCRRALAIKKGRSRSGTSNASRE